MLRFTTLVFLGLSSLGSFAQPAANPAWTWSPEPRWLTGRGFICDSYTSFECGLAYGEESSLSVSTLPESTIPVDIVFDETMTTATRMLRQDQSYADAGVGTFNGAAYDMSDPSAPRRLNVVTIEEEDFDKPADGIWNPGSREGNSQDEFLLVMASSYDENGSTYADRTLQSLEPVYVLIARVPEGQTLFETSPATLSIRPPALRNVSAFTARSGTMWIDWTPYASNGATTVRIYLDDGAGEQLAGTVSAENRRFVADGLSASTEYDIRLEALDSNGTILGDVSLSEQPGLNGIEAVARFDPGLSEGSYADIWGYTDFEGTEYALLASRSRGLSIIDITEAPESAPVEVSFVPTLEGASDSKDVKVYGSYAYLVNERGPMQIIDLNDPANPVQVGTLNTQPGISGGGAHNVSVFNGHLWVTGGRSSGNAGLRVYDVRTTPEAPAFVGEFKPNHFDRPYYHDFEVKGTYGFGPSIRADGVDILDVSDPTNIKLVNTFTYPGSGAHNTCASEDGNTLYVGDEVGSGTWTRIFDISDVNNVELVGDIIVDAEAVVHNCYVKGDHLYIAHYTEGLRIFNIENPHAPFEVASYDTFPQPGFRFDGAWSVYPYFASGKLVVSDRDSGLFVLTTEASAVDREVDPENTAAQLSIAPNPTRGQATLSLQLDAPSAARVSLLDVQGRELRTLLDAQVGTDRQCVDVETSSLPPGVYVVRLVAEGQAPVSTMLTVVR